MGLHKILLIDDEKMIRMTTEILLKKKGFAVDVATCGAEGIEMARREVPDLILLDVMMPEMDGWEVAGRLQADETTKKIPIIIFTAGDYLSSEKEAKERGLAGVIRKPCHINEFISQCTTAFEGRLQ